MKIIIFPAGTSLWDIYTFKEHFHNLCWVYFVWKVRPWLCICSDDRRDSNRRPEIVLFLPIPSYTFHHIDENERSQAMIRLHGRFCYQYVGANVQINNCAYSYLFLWLCIWPVWGLSCGLPLTMDSGRALDPRYRHKTFISQVFGTLCLLEQ